MTVTGKDRAACRDSDPAAAAVTASDRLAALDAVPAVMTAAGNVMDQATGEGTPGVVLPGTARPGTDAYAREIGGGGGGACAMEGYGGVAAPGRNRRRQACPGAICGG